MLENKMATTVTFNHAQSREKSALLTSEREHKTAPWRMTTGEGRLVVVIGVCSMCPVVIGGVMGIGGVRRRRGDVVYHINISVVDEYIADRRIVECLWHWQHRGVLVRDRPREANTR